MSHFLDALKAAIKHFATYGFTKAHEVEEWTRHIERAAHDPDEEAVIGERVGRRLEGVYNRTLKRGAIIRAHPKIEDWAVTRLEPQLREELQRRVWAAADLIKLNRREAVAKMLARFKGFATSVPEGGTPEVDQRAVAREIAKPSKSLDFITRRAQVDQTNKLQGNLNDIIADGGGAIAAIWDHVPENERKFRPEHTARHKKFYPIRGSWADEQGLLRAPDGYWQDHELPGQLINCQCEAVYLYDLAEVPIAMLTAKGKAAL